MKKGKNVCVVADDTDVYILLLFVGNQFMSQVYFRQGKHSDKSGITYHEILPLADYLGNSVSSILPAFHALTGCDYTTPFFGRTKFTCFKKMLARPETIQVLESLKNENANISHVVEFILHIIYNRRKTEKTPGEARYKMLFVGKGNKKSLHQQYHLI